KSAIMGRAAAPQSLLNNPAAVGLPTGGAGDMIRLAVNLGLHAKFAASAVVVLVTVAGGSYRIVVIGLAVAPGIGLSGRVAGQCVSELLPVTLRHFVAQSSTQYGAGNGPGHGGDGLAGAAADLMAGGAAGDAAQN